MRIPTPEHIKSAVIDAWMMGKTRDKIASQYNISTGSVSNIIEQWKNMIGVFDANNLRELGLALKKAGMTPVQCANGLRIINILNQLDINENHLIDFLNKLYNGCNEQRVTPIGIVKLVKVINNYPETNSLNKIPKIIKKRKQEKINLDAEIYCKKLEIQKLDREKERKRKEMQDLQDELESFRKEIQKEKKEFMLFKDAKAELTKHDIPIQTLEPLINVIKIFEEKHFSPLTILCEFSDINDYRNIVKNKKMELKELELRIQDLKTISDSYEKKIKSKQVIVQSLNQLENFGFDVSDIKNLEMVFSDISKKYSLDKKEIKIRFFKYIISYFNNFISLQQDIFEKINNVSILDGEISSRRKVIESQPIVFSILQNLVSAGFNEHEILMAFNIFKTDLINNMPYGDRTYFERLSKDLNKYPTVRDTLQGLNNKILIRKSYIDKLAIVKSNLEVFLCSLVMTIIYFYSTILLNAQQQVQQIQIQIQKNNLIKGILLIYVFNYLLQFVPLFIVIKEPKSVRSKFKIEEKNNNNNNLNKICKNLNKRKRKEKVVNKLS